MDLPNPLDDPFSWDYQLFQDSLRVNEDRDDLAEQEMVPTDENDGNGNESGLDDGNEAEVMQTANNSKKSARQVCLQINQLHF